MSNTVQAAVVEIVKNLHYGEGVRMWGNKVGMLFLQFRHALVFLHFRIASTLLKLFEEGKKKAEWEVLASH